MRSRILAANGLSAEELKRAKKKLLGKQAIAHQRNSSLAYTAALDELYGLGYLHHYGIHGGSNWKRSRWRKCETVRKPVFPGSARQSRLIVRPQVASSAIG